MSDTPMEKANLNLEMPALPVQVHAQYVKDFSFENPGAPDTLRAASARPETDVNIVLDATKIADEANPDLYESTLKLTVRSGREGSPLFISEVVYAALVTIKNVPPASVKAILYVEVPHMLFPFARQMVANAVSAGGFPPLLLSPVDFRAMYASKNNETAASAA